MYIQLSSSVDSIAFVVGGTSVLVDEPLVLVAQNTDYYEKTFTTNDASAVYTLGSRNPSVEGVGLVSGTLTVAGTVDGDNISKLYFGNFTGFELANATELNFTDVHVEGHADYVVNATNADSSININENSKDNTNVLDYCIKEIKSMGYEFASLDEFER